MYERLDKVYGSNNWFLTYPNTGVRHFAIQISNHAPLELDTNLIKSQGILGDIFRTNLEDLAFDEYLQIHGSILDAVSGGLTSVHQDYPSTPFTKQEV